MNEDNSTAHIIRTHVEWVRLCRNRLCRNQPFLTQASESVRTQANDLYEELRKLKERGAILDFCAEQPGIVWPKGHELYGSDSIAIALLGPPWTDRQKAAVQNAAQGMAHMVGARILRTNTGESSE